MSDVFPQAAKAAILAVLHAAAHRHYKVTRMKLAKLLYLCDLESVRSGGEPFTGVTWKWLHYGPYNNALRSIEDELVLGRGIDRTTADDNFYGNTEVRLRPIAEFPPIDPDAWAIVSEVVDRYGKMAPGSLKDVTYQTEPMLTAQEAGQRGVVLDLLEARPLPDISPSLRVLRKVRDRLEEASTDTDVWDDIRDENAPLAAARRSATSRMLEE